MFIIDEEEKKLIDEGHVVENLGNIEFLEGIDVKAGITTLLKEYNIKLVNILIDIGTLEYQLNMYNLALGAAEKYINAQKEEKERLGIEDIGLKTELDQKMSAMFSQKMQVDELMQNAEKQKRDFFYYQHVILGLQNLLAKQA